MTSTKTYVFVALIGLAVAGAIALYVASQSATPPIPENAASLDANARGAFLRTLPGKTNMFNASAMLATTVRMAELGVETADLQYVVDAGLRQAQGYPMFANSAKEKARKAIGAVTNPHTGRPYPIVWDGRV